MRSKFYIIGIGPGDREYILPAASRLIENSDVIIGGRRNLHTFDYLGKETVEISNNLEEVYSYILGNIDTKKIAVLVTGDPGIYSMLTYLKSRLHDVEMEAVPGISSIQYLCSRLKLNWNDMFITSLHGRRQDDIIDIIRNNKKVAIFTGGNCRPGDVCRMFMNHKLATLKIAVGENLSYRNERIVEGSVEDIAAMSFDSLSIMIVQHDGELENPKDVWMYETHGIPDGMFVRGDVPMTKEEVRSASISKLRLMKNSVVYDVGAGTGSVSIECALKCTSGKVYAVEKNSEAVKLILQNAEKFKLDNVEIIEGEAPGAFHGLPSPDRVFVGGTGGNMSEILEWLKRFNNGIRVVVNAVTIESVYEAVKSFEDKRYKNVEVVSISAARGRKVGSKHLMQAINPVYIISADKDSMEVADER
jgi:precorrin-6Y C5,15-methyltransferase (decarboxylating)